MKSLWARLLLANLILLPLFLGSTGFFLERSFRVSLESAAQERLKIQVLTLLAEADYDTQLVMPEALLETRFNQANSGLYAKIFGSEGRVLWASESGVNLQPQQFALEALPEIGEQRFTQRQDRYQIDWTILWQTEDGREAPLVFSVQEDTRPTSAQLASYRRSLLFWLGAASLALMAGQLLVLKWGLRPLQRLASDIARLEKGESDVLQGPYPREIRPLTTNLESLLASEKQRRQRTRNTLSDLAHSLKTPLSIVRSADNLSGEYPAIVDEQIDHMEKIVSYQLQRSSGGTHNLLTVVPLFPVIERLVKTFQRVYEERGILFELAIREDAHFRGDERDVLELLGNLIDNACKYGRSRVRISARNTHGELELAVEDDGPGIPEDLRVEILRRGIRADSTSKGHGIGLAISADIAASYSGKFTIENSPLGGAKVKLVFG